MKTTLLIVKMVLFTMVSFSQGFSWKLPANEILLCQNDSLVAILKPRKDFRAASLQWKKEVFDLKLTAFNRSCTITQGPSNEGIAKTTGMRAKQFTVAFAQGDTFTVTRSGTKKKRVYKTNEASLFVTPTGIETEINMPTPQQLLIQSAIVLAIGRANYEREISKYTMPVIIIP